jgi:hypothetical protein
MHRPKLSRKLIKILICASIIVVVVIAVFYGSWIDSQTYYLGVMKYLNSSETKAYVRDSDGVNLFQRIFLTTVFVTIRK